MGEIDLPGRWQRGLRARKAGSGQSVGTVSHRPLPRLPSEEGMVRETRSLPGRRQRGLGAAKAGSGQSVGTVSHRLLPGLPGEEGMARETRSLPGRFMGAAEFVVGPRLYSPMTSEVHG